MAIYVPRAFAAGERAAEHALIDGHPFATLVARFEGTDERAWRFSLRWMRRFADPDGG
jgi:hypothetical protein